MSTSDVRDSRRTPANDVRPGAAHGRREAITQEIPAETLRELAELNRRHEAHQRPNRHTVSTEMVTTVELEAVS